MFSIGPSELILILAVALVIFGPGKLPEIGRAMGRAMSEMQKATKEIQQTINLEAENTDTTTRPTTSTPQASADADEPDSHEQVGTEQSDPEPQSEQGR